MTNTCKLLELNVRIPEHKCEGLMRFSPYSSVNEALQQILLLMLNIDAGPDVLRNYAVYSPPSFGGDEGCWMTAERTLQSYFLTDGDTLETWERPQAPTLIKIEVEGLGTSMTFKIDEDTTVWFIVVKLLKKLQTRNADEYLKGKPQQFGLFLCHTYLEQEMLLDEDSFVMSFTITSHSKLVFKKIPNYIDTGDLELKLLNDWDGINYKSVIVDSRNTVFAALKKLVKIHPVSDYNQYGLFYCPPGVSQGFWLEEEQLISSYGLQNQDFVEFKKKYRAYAVKIPVKGELVYKLDEFATAKQLFDIVMYNCPQYSNDPYWLFVRGGPMIDMTRGLWSYPVCSKVGLQLKQSSQPLSVFHEKKKELFEVDYSQPIHYIMPMIFERFGMPCKREGEYCLIQLSVAGILLDTAKSLLEQGVSHDGTLLLTGPEGSCPVPVIRQDDQQLRINIWEEETNATIIYDKTSASKGMPPNIEAATLNKLVERLTSPTTHDLEYMKAFLMTYLSFTTPQALFTKLMERFDVPEWHLQHAGPEKFFPIQLRVCNTLKYWIETRYQDFSHELTMDVLLFTDRISQRSETKRLARQLREAISKRTSGMKDTGVATASGSSGAVPAIVPSPNSHRSTPPHAGGPLFGKPTDILFEFDPASVARYLSATDFRLYVKIEPTELLNQCWSKPEVQHLAPNVMTVIDRFNTVGGWVASLILCAPKVKHRAARFEYLIKVAEQLCSLHNYLGLMAFISGMNHSSIGRLKFTKQLLAKKSQQSLKDMEKLMSAESSFKTYRSAIHTANPPCLPYLGVYLKDLTFIEDGNKDKINGLINFGKRRLLYTVISEIQQFQQKGYVFTHEAPVEAYLSEIATLDENELYNISLQCEPRSANKIGDIA